MGLASTNLHIVLYCVINHQAIEIKTTFRASGGDVIN
jgi:hypothetical protein